MSTTLEKGTTKPTIERTETCPDCKKGYVSRRSYTEDKFEDYDVPVLNKDGNGMFETHEAVQKDGKGKNIYKDGVLQVIQWEEPIMEKIFVLKSTHKVDSAFCSNALCDWSETKSELIKEYDI